MTTPRTASQVQSAVDAGLTTWPEVLAMLRTELHVPDGAIVVWRNGDRDLADVLVEWVEEEARVRDHAGEAVRAVLAARGAGGVDSVAPGAAE